MTLTIFDSSSDSGTSGAVGVGALDPSRKLALTARGDPNALTSLEVLVETAPTSGGPWAAADTQQPGPLLRLGGDNVSFLGWLPDAPFVRASWTRAGSADPAFHLTLTVRGQRYGVLRDGFVRKPFDVILQEIEDRQRATIDPNLDVSEASVVGKLNRMYAKEQDDLWGIAEKTFNAGDPDAAGLASLVSLSKLTGTERRGATKSTVACDIDVGAGTMLETDVHFASVQGHPDVRFTPVFGGGITKATFEVGGISGVVFRAEKPGPVDAPAGELSVIATPVVGWLSVINTDPATLGQNVATIDELRDFRKETLEATGSGTLGALRADVLRLKIDDATFVQSCNVFENTTDSPDANGLPPHSFEVIVYDGTPTGEQSNLIAQTIWDNRPAGIKAVGSTSGTATDPATGDPIAIPFSRVNSKPVYVDITVATTVDYPVDGDDQVKAAIVQLGRLMPGLRKREPGDDVIALFLQAAALAVPGVRDVTSFKLGFSPSPAGTANLSVDARDIATFDVANVDVTS